MRRFRAGLDAGCNVLNTGAFYGASNDPLGNVDLLREYYDKNPGYEDKSIVVLKGAVDMAKHAITGE